METLPSTDTVIAESVEDRGFIEIMIQRVAKRNVRPMNVRALSQTLEYCVQRIDIITKLIVTQYPPSAENLLALLSTIREVFDAISESTSTLEDSLNGIVGCVDLAVLDVQIAVQVLVEAFISNCDVVAGVDNRSDEAMASAVYCLSSAITTLLRCMSDLAVKIVDSDEIVDVDAVSGLQMIVQTILHIIDRVLYGVKRITVSDLEGVEPSLEKFSLIIQQLANQRMSFASKISPMIFSQISEVTDSLRSNMDHLPLLTDKSIDNVIMAVASIEDVVLEKKLTSDITSLLITLQPMLSNLSIATHSIPGITDSEAYSTDISLQNIMTTIKCLTYYFTYIKKILPTLEPSIIGGILQSTLCFMASNIQTLVDGITLVMERALIDLISLSPTLDKTVLEESLLQLKDLIEPVILTLEHVISTSIELVKNVLSLGLCVMGELIPDLIYNMNKLINNLGIIVNELTVPLVSSKQIPTTDNQRDEDTLTVCIKAFQGVAQNSVQLRVYFNKSIEQIRSYIIEM